MREIALPVAPQRRREGENEIEREIIDAARARVVHGPHGLVRRMRAMHPLEDLGVEALRTDGEAVDPGTAPALDGVGGHVIRIGLERHLGVGRDREPAADEIEQSRDPVRAEERRRAAPKVDRGQGFGLRLRLACT